MTKTIELTQPHRHAGRDYPPGSTLTLPEQKAAWLIGLGRAVPAKSTQPTTTAAKKAKD